MNAPVAQVRTFEENLEARYRVSYAFYRKLPKRILEEVFPEYWDGASMGGIRKQIMDRFPHQIGRVTKAVIQEPRRDSSYHGAFHG